jgi:phosphatidylinositol alpha-1,6-mannosyltransferase
VKESVIRQGKGKAAANEPVGPAIGLMLIAPYFFPRHYGGAPQVFDSLMSRLRAFEVTILGESQGADPAEMERFDREAPGKRGYRVWRLPRLSLHFNRRSRLANLADAAGFFLTTGRRFDRAVRSINPRVVVCGSNYRGGWLLNRLPASVVRINYVLGEELTQQLEYGPLARWFRRAQIRSMREADLNVVISRFSADRMEEMTGVGPENIYVFPCFIDTERFQPPADREALRQRLGWEGRTVLLTLARLIPRKGIDQVLRALKNSSRLPQDWLYLIAGTGPEEIALKELVAQLGLSDRVRFGGRIPDGEIPDLYGAADLFVQPNRTVEGDTEGFGVVFLEANACGTAVIGGRAGGTADAIEVGESGLRVDGDSVEAVAEAIESLLGDPQRLREMGRRGLERARREFSLDRRARQFEELLLERIERKTGRSQPAG